MVYGFVRQSGGFVVLESEEGKGTSVRVYLPSGASESPRVVDEAITEHEQESSFANTLAETAQEHPGGLKILFVEDDPTLRMLTGEVMEELGHDVSLCESAEAALEQLEQN